MTSVPYLPLPIDQSDVHYDYGPDSAPRPGVPAGETVELELADSAVYPGTYRKIWVHVPADCDPAAPFPVVLFQDGWFNLDPDAYIRGGIVLDNLVHAGDIPPVLGIFVDPGVFPGPSPRRNRNAEYDAFDDRYVTLLIDEVVPLVQQRWALSDDREDWAICGGSSGGDCALTAAWMRPDRFSKSIGFLSSFAQIPGGNPYPELIPVTPRKPLRIFLEAGHRDCNWNEPESNWLAENLRVAAALAEAGYDFRLVLGDCGHTADHAGMLLPDALRWVFRPGP